MTGNLYVSSVFVSRTMNTPPLMTSWVREHCLLVFPARCKCNHQYLSHSAALCFSCHSQRCFCHPSDPWQSVSCSWMCCCNKHSLLWLFSVLNSWFVAGKLRHRAAGACSLYCGGEGEQSQRARGAGSVLELWSLQSSVWCYSIPSLRCHLLTFPAPLSIFGMY